MSEPQQPQNDQNNIWRPAEPPAADQPVPADDRPTQSQPAVEQSLPPTAEQPVVPAPYLNAPYGVPPQQPTSGGGEPPVWAVPPAAAEAPKPSRVGKAMTAGVAALVLALGSGVAGAWAALQLDDRGSATTTSTGNNRSNTAAAPVIDRSSLASIAASVLPSVVSVDTGSGEGSGVVLTEDGFILTNNHVVASGNGNQLSVVFSDGKSARATVVGTDPKSDLAVVKADGVSGLKPAAFGDSGALEVGDTVLALGSPLGLEGSVTAGIVSATNRTIQSGGNERNSPFAAPGASSSITGVIQTDAAINPGNSGGALVNMNGEVVGINTAIATSGNSNGNIGVGFAIPSNRAVQVKDQLVKGEKVSHPQLGVSVGTADGGGAVVQSVAAGSAAAQAGLQQGDVITKLGDQAINDSDDLVSAVQSRKVGDRVDITYKRGNDTRTTTATLAEAS